jgi:hypothetical protein
MVKAEEKGGGTLSVSPCLQAVLEFSFINLKLATAGRRPQQGYPRKRETKKLPCGLI